MKGGKMRLSEHELVGKDISAEYTLDLGVPTRILDAYTETTRRLNEEAKKAKSIDIKALNTTAARTVGKFIPKTSQNLELSQDLIDLQTDFERLAWEDGLVNALGPVHQLNFLAFKQDKEKREQYHQYGKAFAEIARPFGGNPKLLASVIDSEWKEVSLVNYYSLSHFAGMAATEAYQHVNREYRLQALNDTTIICTQEVDLHALRRRLERPQEQQARL